MTTTTETPCTNCDRPIVWVPAEPGDGHGYWTHAEAAPGNLTPLRCYSGIKLHAAPAPGQEHTGPGETGPTPGPGETGPTPGLPPSSQVSGDPVLYTRARVAELLAELPAVMNTDPSTDARARWMGAAAASMEYLSDVIGRL